MLHSLCLLFWLQGLHNQASAADMYLHCALKTLANQQELRIHHGRYLLLTGNFAPRLSEAEGTGVQFGLNLSFIALSDMAGLLKVTPVMS